MIQSSEVITPREQVLMEHEKEQMREARAHELRMKELDIEVQKLEARVSSWLRLPIIIIKLPVYMIMAVAFCIMAARNREASQNFWNWIR